MSLSSAVIDAMVAAGCTVEQLAAAMKADLAEVEAREAHKREMATQRKRRQRAKASSRHAMSQGQSVTDEGEELGGGHAMSRGQHGTKRDERDPSSPEGFPPTPPFPKTPSSIPPSPPKGGFSPAEFEKFWEAYPHKVARKSAKAAFASARKRVDFESLMAGLARYAVKADDRPWCNPATWLNGDRWGDEPAAATGVGRPATAAEILRARRIGATANIEAEAVDWTARFKAYQEQEIWPHSWGPKPGEPGCRAQVPVDQDDPLRRLIERSGHKFIIGRSGKAMIDVMVVEKAKAQLIGAA